jgi:hypothetical protein
LKEKFPNLLTAQENCKCDYISSGYYQLVYEADIAYLEGNDKLAFEKLQEAEKTCILLNQFVYEEIELYSKLLLKNKDFDKAIYYIEKLATEYGKMPFNILVSSYQDSILTSNLLAEFPAFNDSILSAIMQKSQEFYTPKVEKIIEDLVDISKSDQEIREKRNLKIKAKDDPVYIIQKHTDSINAKRFFEIEKLYGFPNMKLYGHSNSPADNNFMLDTVIRALVMHISDHFNIEEMILQYIRNGECSPDLYGAIVDRKIMLVESNENQRSLYAIYDNTRKEQILDFTHLNDRRMAVGMPTWEMQKRRTELMKKK